MVYRIKANHAHDRLWFADGVWHKMCDSLTYWVRNGSKYLRCFRNEKLIYCLTPRTPLTLSEIYTKQKIYVAVDKMNNKE